MDSSVVPKDCGNIVIHWPLCYSKNPEEISKDAIFEKQKDELNKILPGIVDRFAYPKRCRAKHITAVYRQYFWGCIWLGARGRIFEKSATNAKHSR